MSNNVLSSLGLARRAGKVLLGADEICQVDAALPLIITAFDASERIQRSLKNSGKEAKRSIWSKQELGHAVGCGEVAVLAVTDAGFADMIRRKMEQQEENA